MHSNFIFCKCEDWQYFANNILVIQLGQPMVKSDRHAMLLPLENRCMLTTEAQPKVKGFDKTKTRLYLPLGLEQFALFLATKELYLSAEWTKTKVKLKCNKIKSEGKDWYEALADMVIMLQKERLIK